MEGRGLRPRRSVDYAAKDVNTATPGWLMLNPHVPDSPALARARQEAGAGKENSKPPAGRKGKSLPEKKDVKPDLKPGKRKLASTGSAAAEPPSVPEAQRPAAAEKGPKAHSKMAAQLATRGRNAGLQDIGVATAAPAQPVPGLPGVVHRGPALAAALVAKAKRRKGAAAASHFSESTGDAGGSAERAAGQPERPPPLAPVPSLPSPVDATSVSAALLRLQEEYAQLHDKYLAIKAQRINELETVINEQTKQAREHTAAAYQLAEHWKAEARRQANFAQTSGAAEAAEERRRLATENKELLKAAAAAESAELTRAAEAADLRQRLADALRCAEAEPVPTADAGVQVALPPPVPQVVAVQPSAAAQTPGRSPAVGAAAVLRSAACKPLHLQEARACCPEGAEISEVYQGLRSAAAHMAGTGRWQGTGSDTASWRVHCCTSAKPLVPYTAGRSTLQPSGAAAEPCGEGQASVDGAGKLPAARPADACLPPHAERQELLGGEGAEGDVARELRFAAGAAACAGRPGGDPPAGDPQWGQADTGVLVAVWESGCGEDVLQSDASNGRPLSNATRKALDMLAGLEAKPAAGGGFTFRHCASGLAFAIGPASPPPPSDDSDAEGSTAEPELAFQPISLGTATEELPTYLHSRIVFGEAQRPMLLARIMKTLGSLALHRAEQQE
ncbi:hypothetical protein WJX81_005637 [Elliptochloris bilobata]|uniref:Monopolin complex subunit Csm1/Pcs1 C-terminal domain-containing protein n=1 Tax=Elliptochloris bilobata TaxID=381761 RepID=A0AAW1R365_9CHLO